MVQAQQGDLAAPRPRAPSTVVTAKSAGWVHQIDSYDLGNLIVELGGGRRRKEDKVDRSVGIEMHVKLGEQVETGQPLMTLFAHPPTEPLVERARKAFSIGDSVTAAPPLIVERVE
jgi:thymidine phosphorylase